LRGYIENVGKWLLDGNGKYPVNENDEKTLADRLARVVGSVPERADQEAKSAL
jgi:hypothetical protein